MSTSKGTLTGDTGHDGERTAGSTHPLNRMSDEEDEPEEGLVAACAALLEVLAPAPMLLAGQAEAGETGVVEFDEVAEAEGEESVPSGCTAMAASSASCNAACTLTPRLIPPLLVLVLLPTLFLRLFPAVLIVPVLTLLNPPPDKGRGPGS